MCSYSILDISIPLKETSGPFYKDHASWTANGPLPSAAALFHTCEAEARQTRIRQLQQAGESRVT